MALFRSTLAVDFASGAADDPVDFTADWEFIGTPGKGLKIADFALAIGAGQSVGTICSFAALYTPVTVVISNAVGTSSIGLTPFIAGAATIGDTWCAKTGSQTVVTQSRPRGALVI